MTLAKKFLETPDGAMREAEASYQIDHQLAPQINPRDGLFMCGFWRSGTTWLQQALTTLLEAKLVFEPIFPAVPEMKAIYAYEGLAHRKKEYLRLYMPFCGAATLGEHPLRDYYGRALRSDLSGRWIRIYRGNEMESFRTRVVLKCVRSQLCLRAVQNTFQLPAVHIYRDPRAVIASARLTNWEGMFEPLNLRRQLLKPLDGRAEFFGNWRDEIKLYDEQDRVTRIAAYWALTEKFVEHSYADGKARMVLVNYEDLCRRREKVVLEIFAQLGLRPVAASDFQALDNDSSSTSERRRGASVEERITGWKKVLTSAEIAAIESVARYFGFEDRLVS